MITFISALFALPLAGFAVIGGSPLEPSSPIYKHIVGIYGQNKQGGYICSGVLVSSNKVLTAAHCVDGKDLKIVFGKNIKQALGLKLQIRQVLGKPTYHPESRMSEDFEFGLPRRVGPDLALLKFKGPTPENYSKANLLLAEEKVANNNLVIATGYGDNNAEQGSGAGILRSVRLKIKHANWQNFLTFQSNGRGVCNGDSGGPVFYQTGDTYLLAGIVHGGRGGSKCDDYGVITTVPAFQQWLSSQLE